MSRISKKFKELKLKNETALIGFITPGCPNTDITTDLVLEMEKKGLDIIEISIPYSDPIADGKIIQESSMLARENGVKAATVFKTIEEIREKSEIPIALMVYFNSIFAYGYDRFLNKCSEVGVDGIIVPDLPMEEREELLEIAELYKVDFIPLVTPTSKDRVANIVEGGSGFVYCVAVLGVTGERTDINTEIGEYIDIVSQTTDLPKAIGFGISTPEMAEKYKNFAEGIIVGSAIVKRTMEDKNNSDIIEDVSRFVNSLKEKLV